MDLLTVSQVCELKGVDYVTVRKATYDNRLDSVKIDEVRGGYNRKILYIVNNEKLKNYTPKRYIRTDKKFIVIKPDQDAWIYRNDCIGKECAGYRFKSL